MSESRVPSLDFRFYRGRVGLTALLSAIGMDSQSEVITQAYTCLAVPEGVLAAGAKPVYADLAADDVNLSVDSVAGLINSKTRAIVVQHTFGYPGPVIEVQALAAKHGIPVIEDCCHTLTSRAGGRTVGTIGAGAFYSFEWGKPVPCGVGGAAVVNDAQLREKVAAFARELEQPSRMKRLRVAAQYLAFASLYRPANYWMLKDLFASLSRLRIAEGNYNAVDESPSPEFGMAMIPAVSRRLDRKLPRLGDASASASANAIRLRDVLSRFDLRPVATRDGDEAVPVRLPVAVDDKPRLLAKAREHRVEVAEWYASVVHPLPNDAARQVGYELGSCPVAEWACEHFVSLPVIGIDERYLEKLSRCLESYSHG